MLNCKTINHSAEWDETSLLSKVGDEVSISTCSYSSCQHMCLWCVYVVRDSYAITFKYPSYSWFASSLQVTRPSKAVALVLISKQAHRSASYLVIYLRPFPHYFKFMRSFSLATVPDGTPACRKERILKKLATRLRFLSQRCVVLPLEFDNIHHDWSVFARLGVPYAGESIWLHPHCKTPEIIRILTNENGRPAWPRVE